MITDTETIYEKCYEIIAEEFGKKYTWEIQAKVMGDSAKNGAKIIIEQLGLPLTVEEYMKKMRVLCAQYLPDARLQPGL